MDILKKIRDELKVFFDRFPPQRRLTMGLTVLGVLGLSAALLIWAFKPQYKMLYSDLSLEDSGKILEVLKEDNIPYKLEQEGRRIMVPADRVYETRLKLAEQELPGEKGRGWELFDKTTLGVTDFVQRLNYQRGLEGELARTILQLDQIEAARVHLVMPEESLFRETQKKTMASVTVRLKKGHRMSPAQVEGITYLVSSAVGGLEPANVTVVDDSGVVMSQKTAADPIVRMTSTQLDLQRQVEVSLIEKGQSLLDKRFGPGKSAIQVTAELDLKQHEQTREYYDADNPAIRSEEYNTSQGTGSDTSSNRSEHSITNYELNLTRERLVDQVGDVERISVAVMVDGIYTPATGLKGEESTTFSPLPEDELLEVERTIRSALGFNPQRGDEISVVSVPFREEPMVDTDQITTIDRWDMLFRYGQKFVTIVAIALLLLLARGLLRKAQVKPEEAPTVAAGRITGAAQYGGELPPPPDIEEEISAEARSDKILQEQLAKFSKEKPDVAARLVRSWLME